MNLNPGIVFLLTLMIGFNWSSNSDPSREILSNFLNFVGLLGMLVWFYAICLKSIMVLKSKDVYFQTMNTYKYAFLATFISIIFLFILNNIEPSTLATQSDLKRGEFYTYKQIFFITILTLVAGVIFLYRNTIKLLASAEIGKESSFSEYYKTFFFLLILPWVAVWFVQPRVKSL